MSLKIKKITDKLEFDTEAQGLPGCDSDCPIYGTVYVTNTTTGHGGIQIGGCGTFSEVIGYNSNITDLM
jgi:hypothetical protein